jgi:hypothetical protein
MERGSPVISLMQVAAVGAGTALGAPFGVFWALAAFRAGDADASAELVHGLHDAGWMFFMIPLPVFTLWLLLIAVLLCSKHNDESVFPRWAGYLNWLEVFGLLPVFLVIFSKGCIRMERHGRPNLPAVLFRVWFVAMSWLLLRAANRAVPPTPTTPTARERELDEPCVPTEIA